MTLPINFKLPELDKAASSEQISSYLQDLTYELQNMYEQTAQNVNGIFRNSGDVDGSQWIPTLSGSIIAGSFTYIKQAGWAHRQGIITDLFFDIEWSAIGAATGRFNLELPYKCIANPPFSAGFKPQPFVGPVFTGTLVYDVAETDSIVIAAIPGTFRAQIIEFESGLVSHPMFVKAPGRIAGSLRYIGVEDE